MGGNNEKMEAQNIIYEFTGVEKGWKALEAKLPVNVGIDQSLVVLDRPNDFCQDKQN